MFYWKSISFSVDATAAEHVSDEKEADRWGNGSGWWKNLTTYAFLSANATRNESIWKDTDRKRETHSEPAAMSRYEVLAVSTPTGMTTLMTFCAGSLLSYWVQSTAIQNTEACQPQHSLHTSKCIHKACKQTERERVALLVFDNQLYTRFKI